MIISLLTLLNRSCLAFGLLLVAAPGGLLAQPHSSPIAQPVPTLPSMTPALANTSSLPDATPLPITPEETPARSADKEHQRTAGEASTSADDLLIRSTNLYSRGRYAEVIGLLSAEREQAWLQAMPALAMLMAKSAHRLEQFDAALDAYAWVVRTELPQQHQPGHLEAKLLRSKALLNVAMIHQTMARRALNELREQGLPIREQLDVQQDSRIIERQLMSMRRNLTTENPGVVAQPATVASESGHTAARTWKAMAR